MSEMKTKILPVLPLGNGVLLARSPRRAQPLERSSRRGPHQFQQAESASLRHPEGQAPRFRV